MRQDLFWNWMTSLSMLRGLAAKHRERLRPKCPLLARSRHPAEAGAPSAQEKLYNARLKPVVSNDPVSALLGINESTPAD
jgi:hypothetical protein